VTKKGPKLRLIRNHIMVTIAPVLYMTILDINNVNILIECMQ